MLINLYIDTRTSERRLLLAKLLKENGFAFYDYTQRDSCITGPCSFNTLEEIQEAMERE